MTVNADVTTSPPQGSEDRGPRLEWAIRESFLDYLGALDDTVVTVDGCVQDSVPAEFEFAVELPVEPGRIRTRGWVGLTAHGGALALELGNPRLTLSDRWVTVHVEPQPGSWIEFARARTDIESLQEALLSEAVLTEVLLTLDGAALFGTAYGPGFRLAPLRLKGGRSAS